MKLYQLIYNSEFSNEYVAANGLTELDGYITENNKHPKEIKCLGFVKVLNTKF